MWRCPNCGRSFKNTNQQHYCGKAPCNIKEYIAMQRQDIQQYLEAVNEAVRIAIPEAEERISWSMPTYWKGCNIIQFAAAKNHIGIYTGPEAVEQFKEQLKPYKTNKGTIQIPYESPLPLLLIGDIAAWCYLAVVKSRESKSCNPQKH